MFLRYTESMKNYRRVINYLESLLMFLMTMMKTQLLPLHWRHHVWNPNPNEFWLYYRTFPVVGGDLFDFSCILYHFFSSQLFISNFVKSIDSCHFCKIEILMISFCLLSSFSVP